jgi:glycosyltransferase involved in cell wall biosynthesis
METKRGMILTRYAGPLKARDVPTRAEGVKVAYLSTYPPRECGIATFCEDVIRATGGHAGVFPDPVVVAMEGGAKRHQYARPVVHVVDDRSESEYRTAAEFINDSPVDVVSIQHEFGIYGGTSGRGMYRFLDALAKPVVTTLHTVLPEPTPEIRDMVRALVQKSEQVMVMNPIATELLRRAYDVSPSKVAFIHHGAPAPSVEPRDEIKQQLGLAGKKVMCTFGLVGAGKGLEHAIQALPEALRRHPNLVYLIVGGTHPGALRNGVDEYRETLTRLIGDLGVADSVQFVNHYLTKAEIIRYLAVSDLYITPYLNPHQICSGTLAYAVAAGRTVISTPYLHARFLLGGDRGLLVDFADTASITEAVLRVLDTPGLQAEYESRARAYGRRLLWPEVGRRYRGLLADAFGQRTRRERRLPMPRSIAVPASAAVTMGVAP